MTLLRSVIKTRKYMFGAALLCAALFSFFIFLVANKQKTYMMEVDYLIWAVLFGFILTNNDEIELIRVTEKSVYQVVKMNFLAILGVGLISEFIIRFTIYCMAPQGQPISIFLKGFFSYVVTLLFYSSLAFLARVVWKNQYISLAVLMFMFVCQYTLHITAGSAYSEQVRQATSVGVNGSLQLSAFANFLRYIDANIFSFWEDWSDIWLQNRLIFLIVSLTLIAYGLNYTKKHDVSIK